jgi:hypothetical protein
MIYIMACHAEWEERKVKYDARVSVWKKGGNVLGCVIVVGSRAVLTIRVQEDLG